MKEIRGIEFYAGSREELLPGFAADFPYIASHVEPDAGAGREELLLAVCAVRARPCQARRREV